MKSCEDENGEDRDISHGYEARLKAYVLAHRMSKARIWEVKSCTDVQIWLVQEED